MNRNMSILEFIQNYSRGVYDSNDKDTMIKAGWHDWFCRDTYLKAKLDKLFPKVVEIAFLGKINIEKSFIFFNNNLLTNGLSYDDFYICDMTTGCVLYRIIPAKGPITGQAEIWGLENYGKGPIVAGSWKDIKSYFLKL